MQKMQKCKNKIYAKNKELNKMQKILKLIRFRNFVSYNFYLY
jgi:hypothetical protein